MLCLLTKILFSIKNVNLRLAVPGPAQLVRRHGGLESGQPVFGVVEAGDGLIQGVGGVVLQKLLEAAESPAGGGEQLRSVRRLVADGALHKGVQPPGSPLAVI